jgi:hypothetical protein
MILILKMPRVRCEMPVYHLVEGDDHVFIFKTHEDKFVVTDNSFIGLVVTWRELSQPTCLFQVLYSYVSHRGCTKSHICGVRCYIYNGKACQGGTISLE